MNSPERFSRRNLAILAESRMLGIRSGDDHRFTGIWFVMVGNRVFVRPWYDKATGWRQAFRNNPRGSVTVSGREIRVRTRPVRGERLFDAVDAAYAAKYDTRASQKWVRGFRLPRRRKTTLELLPA
jgi:hypothetical protein